MYIVLPLYFIGHNLIFPFEFAILHGLVLFLYQPHLSRPLFAACFSDPRGLIFASSYTSAHNDS